MQVLVDLLHKENSITNGLFDHIAWYFIVRKIWIAWHVGIAYSARVVLVGLLLLEVAFICGALGRAHVEAVQDV